LCNYFAAVACNGWLGGVTPAFLVGGLLATAEHRLSWRAGSCTRLYAKARVNPSVVACFGAQRRSAKFAKFLVSQWLTSLLCVGMDAAKRPRARASGG
jgi:hypothetical protein